MSIIFWDLCLSSGMAGKDLDNETSLYDIDYGSLLDIKEQLLHWKNLVDLRIKELDK